MKQFNAGVSGQWADFLELVIQGRSHLIDLRGLLRSSVLIVGPEEWSPERNCQ